MNEEKGYKIYRREGERFKQIGIDELDTAAVIVIPTRDAYEQFAKDSEDAPEDYFMGCPINSICNVFETGIYYYNGYCGQFINDTTLEAIAQNFDTVKRTFEVLAHE